MRISIIAAVARNGVIGLENGLPWRLSADLRHFKDLTMGHTLLMGRRTFESLSKALPGRRTIVLSRSTRELPAEVTLAGSFEQGIELARLAGENELFVAGGGGVYRAALSFADRMLLTRIDADFEGDTYFPEYSAQDWRLARSEEHPPSAECPLPFRIETLERVAA